MQEHPIPQDITGYRFHIIGSMTLKQFAQLGAGCFIAFLFYTTNLFSLLKWTLIGASIGTGALVAFVPFEERPLDHWLTTFIKILYKPTKFYWKKEAKVPEAFEFTARETKTTIEEEIDLSPMRRQRIREYLSSVNRRGGNQDRFESWQETRIDEIMTTFSNDRTVPTNVGGVHAKPDLKVKVRGLGKSAEAHYEWEETQSAVFTQEHTSVAQTTSATDYSPHTPVQLHTPLPIDQVATDISIPQQESIQVSSPVDVSPEETSPISSLNHQNENAYVDPATFPAATEAAAPENLAATTFNADLPFPTPPTEPNKLVGMVLTPENDLINDAIIEIKNQAGATVRAVKTNALGQFFISTPLPDGSYVIETEKEGLQFSQVGLELHNTVVKPIEIRSFA